MITLTVDQCRELSAAEPLAIDPQTQKTYVLVPETVYQRLRGLFDRDLIATGEMVDRIMAEDDANDPWLDSFQSFSRKDAQ